MFAHTPREIREMTKPPYFEYPVVVVNLLWVCAIGMIYAPLAPLVAIGACLVFWFSSVVVSASSFPLTPVQIPTALHLRIPSGIGRSHVERILQPAARLLHPDAGHDGTK